MSRSRLVPISLGSLLCAVSLLGCRKDAPKPAENGAAPASSVAVPPVEPAKLKQSYEELRTGNGAMLPVYAALRQRVNALPPYIEGLSKVTEKLATAEKVLGVTDAKVRWLSSELDAALKAGKPEKLYAVSQQVASASHEVRELTQLGGAMAHDLASYERTAALLGSPATAFSRKLSSGYELKAVPNGLEQRLLAVLDDPKRALDKKTWFDFDRVSFPKSGTELDLTYSGQQLKNLSEIFKAYPALKLALDGYREDENATVATKTLSAERSRATKKELVRLGVAPTRIDAEGKGPEHALCPAAEPTCQAKLGRLAARVTAR